MQQQGFKYRRVNRSGSHGNSQGEYNDIGILSLPALANGVARQVAMAKEISHIIVIDGCKNSCAKKKSQK